MTSGGSPAVQPRGFRASLQLAGSSASSLTRVRRWLTEKLSGLERDHRQDVIQVADELTSNAYEHAGGPHAIHVSRHQLPCLVVVEVEDAAPATPTLGHSRFGTGAHRGRGLVLVDELADAWGVRRSGAHGGGKTVWARISCSG
jgi:anti-sigma regulatory factor (Ser/Thr protein kinase)